MRQVTKRAEREVLPIQIQAMPAPQRPWNDVDVLGNLMLSQRHSILHDYGKGPWHVRTPESKQMALCQRAYLRPRSSPLDRKATKLRPKKMLG